MNRHTDPGQQLDGDVGHEAVWLAKPAADPGTKNQIDIAFQAGPSAAAAARNALAALEGRIDPDLLEDVRLLVSELVTNSVRHSPARSLDLIRMNATVAGGTVRVEVADPGDGFEPKPRDPDRTRPGGWGLYLVDHLADRWGVAKDRLTRGWFELDAGRVRPGEAAL